MPHGEITTSARVRRLDGPALAIPAVPTNPHATAPHDANTAAPNRVQNLILPPFACYATPLSVRPGHNLALKYVGLTATDRPSLDALHSPPETAPVSERGRVIASEQRPARRSRTFSPNHPPADAGPSKPSRPAVGGIQATRRGVGTPS